MIRWMDSTLYEHIMMTRMQMLFEKSLKTFLSGNKTTLIRRVVNLKYKIENNMVEYISYLQDIVTKLVTMKMNIDDEMQASLLLKKLDSSIINNRRKLFIQAAHHLQ